MNAGVVEEVENQLESLDGPGRRLQQARLANRLEMERVASQLHLSVRSVAALERDDYTGLPDAVFVRGYITNYARLVGLAPEPLLTAYNARLPRGEMKKLGRVRMKDGLGASRRASRALRLLLILGVGVLAAFWGKSRLDAPQPSAPETVTAGGEPVRSDEPVTEGPGELKPPLPAEGSGTVVPERSIPPQADPGSLKLMTTAVAKEPAETGSQQPSSSREQPQPPANEEVSVAEPAWPASVVEPVPAEAQSPDAAGSGAPGGEVILELLGPCWVDIRDASGKNKIIGELDKGVQKVIRGDPPFSVVLGNSRAVRLLVNGNPYDVSQHAQGNVARFKLDPRDQGG
jgi:cytoskeleton protein RodZ